MRVHGSRLLPVALAALVLALGLGASGASATGSSAAGAQQATCFFPKTKFVLHAGLAFGAFHRYIYKPFKAGAFTGPDKVKAIAKAAIAGAFVYHELHEALKQAQCSHTLTVLVSPITAVLGVITNATNSLKGGSVPDIASLGSSFDQIGQTAGGVGTPIKDIISNL